MKSRILALLAALALVGGFLTIVRPPPAAATPVAADDGTYELFGRVFPDPHGCLPRIAPFSPWAKGRVCAADFIQFDEMVAGLGFLQEKFPHFVDLFRLDERFKNPDYMSAGLSTADLGNEPNPLWTVRITDERIPDDGKKHFVFPVGIHGIERAGVEGGVRAAEDLVTWAACEEDADAASACSVEGPFPHPILETTPEISITAGETLRRSAIYFIFPNPDGWRRGDRDNGVFYQRYNGNGIDLNRDWPAVGITFDGYTPLSEPESRAFAEVLKSIRSKWDGGIDLHGQLIDRAFSFTLLGQGQHDYGKNQAMLDIVQGAWRDAEKRLGWSPLIKPNDAPADDERVYGVQWGTIWDTIGYTVTGALGDWINQPIGLDGIGIDNEMSLSHIANCGTGTCFIPDAEQLHVDGNKSLIYSMINFTFRPEDNSFRFSGRAAYVHDPRVLSRGASAAKVSSAVLGLDPQSDIEVDLAANNGWTHEFDVLGPTKKVFNGGIKVDVRAVSVGAVSPAALASVLVERETKEGWEVVNSYYNQSFIYLQSGQTIDVNDPEPGHWRVRVESGELGLVFRTLIDFRKGRAWPNPGQVPYSVTNMRFFDDLNRFASAPLDDVSADAILAGTVDLDRYDTLILADTVLPGYAEAPPTGPAQGTIELSPLDASNPTYPCAGHTATDPTPGCEGYFEWEVDETKNNQTMSVALEWLTAANDFDLYVERYAVNGDYWTPVAQSAGSANPEVAALIKPIPGRYRARFVNWASVEPLPQSLTVSFSNEAVDPARVSTRSASQLRTFGSRLRGYVERGGNLLLTDSAVRLLAVMGVIDRKAINEFTGFAGFIGFTPDGSTTTYDHPLARNVQRPGAAEGEFHRHQTYDPGPLGYDIGDDTARRNTAPLWSIDQTAWQKIGGVIAGTSTGDQVTLGELRLGKGVVRVIGALLPFPTDRYFHPYGLTNYAVTYSGYQVLQNAIDYRAPGRTQVGGVKEVAPKSDLPATGVPTAGGVLGVAAIAGAAALARWRRRTT